MTSSIFNSRSNFRLVIFTLQLLGHDLIFVSTKPAAGQFSLQVPDAAEFERALIHERINAELAIGSWRLADI